MAAARRGILILDGTPRFLLGGDYPYYRDDVRNWRPRMESLREAGIEVVTCYVPWRHHAPHDLLAGHDADLTGVTRPDRDLCGFLDLLDELGLKAILKPGPFVHAELPFGGLPDHVDPALSPEIEPERDASGDPIRWALPTTPVDAARILPSPFGAVYHEHARAWLIAFGRAIEPRLHPKGAVVGIQLMNEGIYSESARADPLQLGYSDPCMVRYHGFLEEKYGTMEAYQSDHESTVKRWSDIDPPRGVKLLETPRALLRYLDWSEYQSRLYLDAACLYREALLEAGIPPGFPLFLNLNANGDTYRDSPASNDGWYTRISALAALEDFTFGTTNWLGVVAGDEQASRQYLMAITARRGPALELNWGFSSQYYAPYELASASHFETMLAVAAGATGVVAYTFAGTRAWRGVPDLDDGTVVARTNDHGDETSGDYPGDSPIRSNGARTSKYWALAQLAQYLRAMAPGFVEAGPRAPVAWAVYPPYAWAGQWLPRGDPDDVLWRPPLRIIPRGAYHGLDAFVEMMIEVGGAFTQVDVSRDTPDPDRVRVLCLSAHDAMDDATQERLVGYVRAGGVLIMSGVVPFRDERLRPHRGALSTLFDHKELETRHLEAPQRIEGIDGRVAVAVDLATLLEPPPGAEVVARLEGRCVGYVKRTGAGAIAYMGSDPWRARWSKDDRRVAAWNQAFVWSIIERLAGEDVLPARATERSHDVMAWQHGPADADVQHVFAVVREYAGESTIEFSQRGGAKARAIVCTPSQSVHAFAARADGPVACYLKGVNDLRAEAVPPKLEIAGRVWEADVPCDLCVTPMARGLALSVSHVQDETRARVRLDLGDRVIEREVEDMAHAASARPVEVDIHPPRRVA